MIYLPLKNSAERSAFQKIEVDHKRLNQVPSLHPKKNKKKMLAKGWFKRLWSTYLSSVLQKEAFLAKYGLSLWSTSFFEKKGPGRS